MNHSTYLARFSLPALSAILLSLGVARATAADAMANAQPMAPTAAIAVLVPGSGSSVHGTVTFTQEHDGVRVKADVTGLTPGLHGFHVHEKGDLSKGDLTSAGGHFNPEHHHHAGRDAMDRHAGDLGNLEAGADGHATLDVVDTHLKLSGPESIIGRGVIVHAKADDMKSQPAGDAGSRVAGGVIGVTSP